MEGKYAAVVDSAVMSMEQMMEGMINKMNKMLENAPVTVQGPGARLGTYAAAVAGAHTRQPTPYASAANRTPQQAAILARKDAKAKQVLIDVADRSTKMLELSEEELVMKAMLAVEGMEVERKDAIIIIGARKLKNGGVILETKTREGAEVLKRPDAKKEFACNFGGDIEIEDRNHPIIVEHMPTGFQPDISVELRKVEDANNLEDNSLLSAKWIKPPH